jgi:hypothetical protein
MGVWYYLVNTTRKEIANGGCVHGNFGKWGEFNPLEAYDKAIKQYGWSSSDNCKWIGDDGTFAQIPLVGYVWHGDDDDAQLEWYCDHMENDLEGWEDMLQYPIASDKKKKIPGLVRKKSIVITDVGDTSPVIPKKVKKILLKKGVVSEKLDAIPSYDEYRKKWSFSFT